jgi:hypothetical protein
MGMFSEFFAEVEDVFIEGDGQYDLEVVGESHYQRHLNVLSERYSKMGGDRELIAKLHYENTNPHDKKAIRAVINGGTVGYLSRKDARLFRKRIEKVGFEGLVIYNNYIAILLPVITGIENQALPSSGIIIFTSVRCWPIREACEADFSVSFGENRRSSSMIQRR